MPRKRNPTLEDFAVAVIEALVLAVVLWCGWDLFALPIRGLPLISPIQAFGLVLFVGAVAVLAGEVFNS